MKKTYSLILLATSHFFIDFLIGVWPIYKTLAHLDIQVASLIAGICLIVGEAMQVVFGLIDMRLSSRTLLLMGLILATSASLLSHVSQHFFLFLTLLCLYLGSSAFHPAAAGIIGRWRESSKSFLLTLFYTGGTLGAAVSQFVFAKMWTFSSGETLYLSLPSFFLILLFIFHQFSGEKKRSTQPSYSALFQQLKEKKGILFSLFVIQVIMQTLVVATMFLLPEVLQGRRAATWLIFGGGDFFFVIGAALFGVIAGYFADRLPYAKILFISCISSIGAFTFFLFTPVSGSMMTSLILFLLGGTLGMTAPVILAASQSQFSENLKSLISGVFLGGAGCFAGLGVMIVGSLAKLFHERPLEKALFALSSLLFIAFVFALQLMIEDKKTYKHRAKQLLLETH